MSFPLGSLHRSILFLAALLAFAATLAAGLAAADSAGARSPASCGYVTAKVSKQEVRAGGWVRVAGRTCRNSEIRPRRVRIKMYSGRRWRTVGIARTRRSGRYSKSVRVRAPRNRIAVRVRVRAIRARSRSIRVRVGGRRPVGGTRPNGGRPTQPAEPTAPTQEPTLPSEPLPSGDGCVLRTPGSAVGLTASGCRLVASDTVSNPDPNPFWGKIDCAASSRHAVRTADGDPHVTATGAAQPDDSYRRLSVLDGDDIWGERCELGFNNHIDGPTAFYREGMRRATFASLRLPENFPLLTNTWQTVLQQKQAQPSNNGGNGPIIEIQANRGMWVLNNDWNELWTFPAQRGVWTRIVLDVFYSQDPAIGSIQMSVDLNADGDVDDAGERSPRFRTATLRRETAGGWEGDGIAAGESIPSHLRAGVYHNPIIPCAVIGACTTEVDNVQVLAP